MPAPRVVIRQQSLNSQELSWERLQPRKAHYSEIIAAEAAATEHGILRRKSVIIEIGRWFGLRRAATPVVFSI